ncbi:hypothetical protein AX17_001229 [Amanita inopinata Kibby_2008]|nr:hypothetical protein AX17_001229 [Amanita inopinata Kibby_2008]
MTPKVYDPKSPEEQPVPLPSAPLINFNSHTVIQPPLTHRGTGPGLVVFLPNTSSLELDSESKVLDPEPVKKWAEEGFAVAGVTLTMQESNLSELVQQSFRALSELPQVESKYKFAVIIYDPANAPSIISAVSPNPQVSCLVAYSFVLKSPLPFPTLLHLPSGLTIQPPSSEAISYTYTSPSPYFVLPHTTGYDSGSASVAHSRTLAFLRKHVGGPLFDLEAIWDEHTYFEFEVRSVAKTMGTMVAEPYVNHVPTMAGGVGRQELTAFYRDHFIFSNPADAKLHVISRTVGPDRVVDEFIYQVTHDRVIDWLLPGVPPSGNKLSIPMLAVVNIRGDRLYHEHIWWDQATALRQAGVLPTHLPYATPEGIKLLRIPVAGVHVAEKLIDETKVESNAMLSDEWGIKELE